MGKGRKVLSDDHALALIKQTIGMIFGDPRVEADATTEIAEIEARHATTPCKSTKALRLRQTPGIERPQA